MLPLTVALAFAAPPSAPPPGPKPAEAAALWRAAQRGAPDAEWLDAAAPAVSMLLAPERIEDEEPEDEAQSRARLAARIKRAAGCTPPGTIIAWPELPTGFGEQDEWPRSAEVRGVAIYDLGCPAALQLSAAVMIRYATGDWRILDVVGPEALADWSEAINETVADPPPPPKPRKAAPSPPSPGPGGPTPAPRAELPPGTVGGELGGVVGGTLSAPPAVPDERTVHWTEAQVKSRVAPKVPDGLTGTCTVRLHVDTAGKVSRVDAKTCDAGLFDSIQAAALATTFYPLKVGGVATPSAFDMRYVVK